MRKEPFEQVHNVADKLADALAQAHGGIEHVREARIAMEQTELTLDRRKPTRQILEQSRTIPQDVSASELARPPIYAQRRLTCMAAQTTFL